MKKNLTVLVILLSAFITGNLFAQGVGINNPIPAPSAMLDVVSTSKGMLIPRMTSAQRLAIVSPANGLMVYETTTNQFFYFDGATWKSFSSGTSGWNATGNTGTVDGTNFIGTTDNVPFNIRVNNQKAGRIDGSSANALFGFQAGNSVTGASNSFFGHQAGFSTTNAIDNSFYGRNSGFANTTGTGNSFFGNGTGFSNTTGSNNTFIGRESGKNNTTGFSNVAIGVEALKNSTASNLVAVGDSALRGNTTGVQNTAVGSKAGFSTTTGQGNTFAGYQAGFSNSTGGNNTFFGKQAGFSTTTATQNSYFGANAGANSTAFNNSFFGTSAGLGNTTGGDNSFFGKHSGFFTSTGQFNSFFGSDAGSNNTTASFNTFIGKESGRDNTIGANNSFLGAGSGTFTTTGGSNSFFGFNAGLTNTTGSSNTIIGNIANLNANNLTNASAIGANARVDASNSMVLGSINGVNGATSSVNVGIGISAPKTRLQIDGGSDAGSIATSGYLCVGNTASTNVLYDDNEILARDNGVVSDLWMQADGGNLAIGMVPSPAFNLHMLNNSAAKPTSSAWIIASDARLKTNVHDYEDGLSKLQQIHPVWFTYTGEAGLPKETGVGVLAQELQTVAPYMVGTWKYKDKSGASTEYLSIDNGAMTYMLINSVKELKEQNDSQQYQIEELKKIIEQLKR